MPAADPARTRRVLWLGNHALLLKTELPRLRRLGFEVFHAPCRRLVREHQSATTDWEPGPTTLDPAVHARLVEADLYFKPIEPEVFDLLNRHFDAAIVAIQARWVPELLRGFNGKIVYRTYGEGKTVSEQLWRLGAFRALTRRDNFWFVPFATEYSRQEHSWVRAREVVVPYCVDSVVADAQGSWQPNSDAPEVMLSCPNIAGNPFFAHHFTELKRCFNHSSFRIYGVQPEKVSDPQVVGTIPFASVVSHYRSATAVLYTYRDPTVVFLAPIEMMIVGGPVVYLSGSLLDKFMGPDAPGRARDMLEARAKCDRLLGGDIELSRAIVRSQKAVRERYLPDHVWPRFDAAMRLILDAETRPTEPIAVTWSSADIEEGGRVVVLAHHASLTPVLDSGRYVVDPIVAQLVLLLRAILARHEQERIVLVCTNDAVVAWHGLLSQHFPSGPFTLFCLGREQPVQPISPSLPEAETRRLLERAKTMVTRAVSPGALRRLERAQARFLPPVQPDLFRGGHVISLHPHCEDGLGDMPRTRLYAETEADDALALSISQRPRA
jgi:hypothetical protein